METVVQTGRKGINGNTLKMLAIVTMVLDHIGAVLIEVGVLDPWSSEHVNAILRTESGIMWYWFDTILRLIGRVSFPIFCFLLVEGFFYTRDRRNYLVRLFLFAMLSEIPFDLAVFNRWFYLGGQNIYFTLCIGIMTMACLERFHEQRIKQILSVVSGCVAGQLLKTDYGMWGVVLILAFYLFRSDKRKQMIAAGTAAALGSMSLFGAAALSLIPIGLYNGSRGEKNMKYFFYFFYPAHLLILALVRILFLK